ncbi:MAG TPA: M56 family metallopeptidase [Terriglobales bacterium]|nr:M56 family metallopeptidase [Terriglobales bacterium]
MTHSALWTSIAPALANHLWQSTLFAVAAGLLTLTLRENHARARYVLWLIASLKFLVPFSWLVAIGNRFSWHIPASTAGATYSVIEQVGQPFTQAPAPSFSPAPIAWLNLTHLAVILLAIWLCGFLIVFFIWLLRWQEVSIAICSSVPLDEGREAEALRRQQCITGIRRRVDLLLSASALEPGIFGVARPVLVWPKGISAHLENPHLESILAHELWHVRRRDNLTAALHMIVEAIFWFHPLVWWMGARLIEERERACDEAVLELGGERHIYAESILKVCEFCVSSPLAFVSGVTGADLKRRMVYIMSEQVACRLNLRKKLLLAVAGALAIAAPIVVGAAQATPGRAPSQNEDASRATFDNVSITPSAESAPTPTSAGAKTHMVRVMFGSDSFFANNVTLRSIIEEAYDVQSNQIIGGPDWLNSSTFDILAQLHNSDSTKPPFPPDRTKVQKLLQTLLADSAKLTLHNEVRLLESYALVVSEGGSKLQPSQSLDSEPVAPFALGAGDQVFMQRVKVGPDGRPEGAHLMRMQMGEAQAVGMDAQGVSISDFARQLSRQLGVAVVDKTGLKGNYDFKLQWKRGADQSANATENQSFDDTQSPSSLMTAMQDQLGLKLEPQKGPTLVLIIDHIEKPTEN